MALANCKRCGSTDRYSNGKCRPCQRLGVARWISENREKYLRSKSAYRAKNKRKIRKALKKWQIANREHTNTSRKERYKTDLNFRLASRLRGRLNEVVRGGLKTGSAVSDLGCSIPELRQYLEHQFKPGMTWENWGSWHIDHIKALSKFDLTDREQLLKACHYSNLQPLWAKDNLSKGNK